MIGTPPPNKDRFLCAIAERVPPDRVQAVFLFPPIRQGQVETCVAVLAVEPPPAPLTDAGQPVREEQNAEATATDASDTSDVAEVMDAADTAESDAVIEAGIAEKAAESSVELEAAAEETSTQEPDGPAPAARPMVLTARYRHTIKGPDRGKWELEILEQADAPLVTIETVVRGVQARLDDQAEPERLGADDLRTALVEGVWTAPAR